MEIDALGGVFHVTCTPVFDERGQIRKIIHIATDISERKRTEEKLREAYDIINGSPVAAFLWRNAEEWEEYDSMIYSGLKEMPVLRFESDMPYVRKDGSEISCRTSVSRVGRGLGPTGRIVASFEDVTEQMKADEERKNLSPD